MPYAITLCLDDAAPVERLLAVLGELADDVVQLGYKPHVTLGLYPDDADPAALRAVLEALAGPVVLEVAGIGMFPPGVVYAAPCPSAALLELQAACGSGHPHFRVGGWMPHITLSQQAGAAGVALLAAAWVPFQALCSTVELVRFPPVALLAGRRLSAR